MICHIGLKSDPVEYRYSYEWLFTLMEKLDLHHLQLGTFFELYRLPDRYFTRLRKQAEDHGVQISSCFTSHRELGGFFSQDPDFHAVARSGFRRLAEIGVLLGAPSVGANPGSILRDQMETKESAQECYHTAMTEIAEYAAQLGLEVLTLEPMSASAEPPTAMAEITRFMERLNPGQSSAQPTAFAGTSGDARTVPVYLCSDIAHGYADESGVVIESNMELFEHSIPWMWEFHIKNTDLRFDSTFGFGPEELERGIVDLKLLAQLISTNTHRFPRHEIVGYLELGGPKLGRDYSDPLLEDMLTASVMAVRERFLTAMV